MVINYPWLDGLQLGEEPQPQLPLRVWLPEGVKLLCFHVSERPHKAVPPPYFQYHWGSARNTEATPPCAKTLKEGEGPL